MNNKQQKEELVEFYYIILDIIILFYYIFEYIRWAYLQFLSKMLYYQYGVHHISLIYFCFQWKFVNHVQSVLNYHLNNLLNRW